MPRLPSFIIENLTPSALLKVANVSRGPRPLNNSKVPCVDIETFSIALSLANGPDRPSVHIAEFAFLVRHKVRPGRSCAFTELRRAVCGVAAFLETMAHLSGNEGRAALGVVLDVPDKNIPRVRYGFKLHYWCVLAVAVRSG